VACRAACSHRLFGDAIYEADSIARQRELELADRTLGARAPDR